MFIVALLAAAAPHGVAAVPINSPGSWATTSDYPANERASKVGGTTKFKIEVGDDGKPLNCMIVEGSGSKILDDKTCELVMERALFNAVSDEHNKIQRTYQNSMRWIPPKNSSPDDLRLYKLEATGITVTAKFDTDGSILGCEQSMIGNPQDDLLACNRKGTRNFFEDTLSQPLKFYERATVLILFKPAAAAKPTIDGYDTDDEYFMLTSAAFEVPASGVPQKCVAANLLRAQGEDFDICTMFDASEDQFEPDPARTTPVPMEVLMDLWAKKRE